MVLLRLTAYIFTMTFKEEAKAKEDTANWVAVSKEGNNEYGEAGEVFLCITPLFDRGNAIVLEELVSVVHGLGGWKFPRGGCPRNRR